MKHKCKNHHVCGGWVKHGVLCDKCKEAAQSLDGSWQTIEQELVTKPDNQKGAK